MNAQRTRRTAGWINGNLRFHGPISLTLAALLSACSSDATDEAIDSGSEDADATVAAPACDEAGDFDPAFAEWGEPVAPKRETVGPVEVVWLSGSPYEMGQQHGELLLDRMSAAWQEASTNPLLTGFFTIAENLRLIDLAYEISYPEFIEECQGFVDTVQANGVDFTMDHCVFLSAGDLLEFVVDGMPTQEEITPGCTQIMASGDATADGRLYHARLMDWMQIDFVIENPVVFVRQPQDAIPHVVIGFPGGVTAFQGMNARGLAVAQNEIHARDASVHDLTGISHTQLHGRILAHAHTLEQAREMILDANHMTLETSGVSDGNAGEGAFFEMAPFAVGVRPMADGLVFATNHFVSAQTDELDKEPPSDSTLLRWDRLEELLLPDGADSLYGRISPETLVEVMRDRRNPWTGQDSPDTFDDASSIATDGAIYAVVFDPARRTFWLASQQIIVPDQPFYGFSLGELLELPGCQDTTPVTIP